ncbi:MAG: glutamine amidotransferase-related protein [Candidatus Woesearchaeota archaeon]
MILLIDICNEEMHYHEFVRPIEDILRTVEEPFITRKYSVISRKDIDSCHRIIIAGTSLKDVEYSKNLSRLKFLKNFDKPILAICGGMQILCMLYGCKLADGSEIGLYTINFNAEFLGVKGSRDVYMLHNMMIKDDALLKDSFNIYSRSMSAGVGYVQAVKHKHFKHYGVLFHPEVRNKDMIINFLRV